MSVQNALTLIKNLREEKPDSLNAMLLLTDLSETALKKQLPCSEDELIKAFEIDWKMRWLKLQTK